MSHKAAVNPRRPKKLLILLDFSVDYRKRWLNDIIRQGPDTTAKERIPVSSDGEEMFMYVNMLREIGVAPTSVVPTKRSVNETTSDK